MTKLATFFFILALSVVAALGGETAASTNGPGLEVRFYKLQTNAVYSNLHFQEPLWIGTNSDLLRNYFQTNGVDLRPPSSVFLNYRTGELLVRARPEIQKKIPPLVEQLNTQK